MNNIFFTSDLHFFHTNIIRLSNRPFKNVSEMNTTLINNINARVDETDTLYDLGDFSFDERAVPELLARINCKNVIRIKGSHDPDMKQPYMLVIKPKGLVDEIGNQRRITLCHYPMRSWDTSHYASWHLYGHHHGRLSDFGLSFDVGVDTNNYFPYSLKDVENKMRTKIAPIDYRRK